MNINNQITAHFDLYKNRHALEASAYTVIRVAGGKNISMRPLCGLVVFVRQLSTQLT
jgi:hypothetical protein